MKSAALIGLVVAAVALAGVTFLVVRPKGDEGSALSASAEERPFLPDLRAKVNTAKAVTVKSSEKEFTIHQDDAGVWRVADKGDYAANLEKVKQVLAGLADLRGGELKTSKPELYSKIGVQDPAKPAEPGERSPSLLTVKDGAGQVLASVIVGNPKYGPKPAVYVRRAGEPQSWLALGTLEVPGEPTAWMETKILELPRERVKSVTVTHADGGVLAISREKASDTAFTVHDVPEGKKLRSPNVGDPLGAGLSYLQFEDVTTIASFKTEGEGAAKPKWTADYRTFDGLVLVIQAFDQGGKTWAKLLASFDDTSVAPTENRPAGLKSGEDVLKEITELNARFSPWVFQIPDWKAQALAATMESMLEAPPAPPAGMNGDTGAPTPKPAPALPPPAATPTPPPAPAPSGDAPKPAPTPSNPG